MTNTLTEMDLIKQVILDAEKEFDTISFSERSQVHKAAAKIMDMERQRHNQGTKVSQHLNYIRNVIESNIDELSK